MIGRITQIMEREALAPSKFAEEIGIQRSAMSHILNGRNNVSLDVLMKILGRFTYVDADWLLFGKGEMERALPSDLPVNTQNTAVNPSERPNASEYRREIGVDTPVNIPQVSAVERFIQAENTSKKITKIMIFYSDNTFDTFISEKSKKE
ncbi:MAG: helix-turn-helix transcriptional regulator [Parabacteroides sp.]|nr:helix-turn-helix transcriptional regulator [Parabacteroides sp.]